MLGASHKLTAVAGYVAYSTWLEQQPVTTVAVGALVATAASAGWSSPDMDQTKPFIWVGRVLGPAGKLVSHRRGVTHWWAIPVIMWWLGLPTLHPEARWAATALLIGWASHIAGDAIFGRIPVTPGWGPMIGARLKTSGVLEEGPKWWPVSPLRTGLIAVTAWMLWYGVTLTV